jgi:hypothetical protein
MSSFIRKATNYERVVDTRRHAEDSPVRRVAALSFIVLVAGGCGSSTHRATPAMLRQACVVRWNWLHYGHEFVPSPAPNATAPVVVRVKPCRIEVDYRLSRSDPNYKSYLGMYFGCVLNRFQAYVCDSHAIGLPGDPPRKGQNGRYFVKDGTIRLNRPPVRPIAVSKPGWAKRYPIKEGFIEPFDQHGALRPGLALRGRVPAPGCATFRDLQRSTFVICGAGIVCFVPHLPVHERELIACPTNRGSRVFNRGRLVVYPNP